MRNFIIKCMLAVTLVVHSQYMMNGELLVDYQLDGQEYTGVYYEDMFDDLNSTLELSYE
jgi:hypothetical protein